MKKSLICVLLIVLAVTCLASCDSLNHGHIRGRWEYNDESHWRATTCIWNKCDIDPLLENHVDEDKNAICDICDFDGVTDLNSVARIVLDYEEALKDEIDTLNEEKPQYHHYYSQVDEVFCLYTLSGNASADDIIAKHDMNNLFAKAEVSAYNSIKAISVVFDRNDFTEAMHRKIKRISDEEPLVGNLLVEMEKRWSKSYMPKIEYYTDNKTTLDFETASSVINLFDDREFIIKSKLEYDNFLNTQSEKADSEYLTKTIDEQKELYDESFFEEKALIITKIITRTSGSVELTVNNLYISGNTVYVVVKTDAPAVGSADMQYTSFTCIIPKDKIVDSDRVITLE